MTLNLPPWARRLWQSWWLHLIVIPAVLAAGPAFFECAGDDLSKLSLACFKVGGSAAALWIIRSLTHSLGSASFNPDGTVNKQVQEVVTADQAKQPVAVVPVASAGVREQIQSAVDVGAPVAVVASPSVAVSNEVMRASADSASPTVASIASKP